MQSHNIKNSTLLQLAWTEKATSFTAPTMKSHWTKLHFSKKNGLFEKMFVHDSY